MTIEEAQQAIAGFDPTYDYPRLRFLIGLLQNKHGITVSDPPVSERPHSAMDFEIRYKSNCIRLSLHESTGRKGFWGLGKNSLEYLSGVDRWLLVLFLLRNDSYMADGWIITEKQWESFRSSISSDQNRNYKINRPNLVEDDKLSGIEKIAQQVAAYLKSE